uniref:Uncharacterized protein n=1 Tax=Onchocerca volvulus TaxID=6282 RepID=A0A8R1XS82_ONCVO
MTQIMRREDKREGEDESEQSAIYGAWRLCYQQLSRCSMIGSIERKKNEKFSINWIDVRVCFIIVCSPTHDLWYISGRKGRERGIEREREGYAIRLRRCLLACLLACLQVHVQVDCI